MKYRDRWAEKMPRGGIPQIKYNGDGKYSFLDYLSLPNGIGQHKGDKFDDVLAWNLIDIDDRMVKLWVSEIHVEKIVREEALISIRIRDELLHVGAGHA